MYQVYRPSNRVTPVGVIGLLIAAVVVGVIVGALSHFVGRFFWLIIMFPIVAGLIGGAALAGAVKALKVRNVPLAIAAGLLFGVVAYGAYQYGDYLKVRSELAAEGLSAEMIDFAIESETGSPGFLGFMKLQAQEGVSIGRPSSSGSGVNIGQVGTWIYFLVELLIFGGVAAAMARSAANDPFCEQCDVWYGKGEFVGSAPDGAAAQLTDLLRSGNYQAAGSMLQPAPLGSPSYSVSLRRCSQPAMHGSVFTLTHHTTDNKNNAKTDDILSGVIGPHEAEVLRQAANSTVAPAQQQYPAMG